MKESRCSGSDRDSSLRFDLASLEDSIYSFVARIRFEFYFAFDFLLALVFEVVFLVAACFLVVEAVFVFDDAALVVFFAPVLVPVLAATF